jgi:hypothetical protein
MGSVGRGRRAAAGLRQHLAVLRVVGEHGGPLGCHGHRCLGGHGHRCLGGHGHRCLRGRGGPTTDSAARLMWAGLRGGGRGCRACGRGTCAAINISALRRRRRLLLLRRITVSGGYLSTTHDRVTTTHRCTGCRRRCGGMVTRRSVSSGRDHAGRTPVIVCTWGHRAEFRMNIAAHRSAQQWQQAQDRYSRSQTRQDCCHGIVRMPLPRRWWPLTPTRQALLQLSRRQALCTTCGIARQHPIFQCRNEHPAVTATGRWVLGRCACYVLGTATQLDGRERAAAMARVRRRLTGMRTQQPQQLLQ